VKIAMTSRPARCWWPRSTPWPSPTSSSTSA
jgi:hypothetical protein